MADDMVEFEPVDAEPVKAQRAARSRARVATRRPRASGSTQYPTTALRMNASIPLSPTSPSVTPLCASATRNETVLPSASDSARCRRDSRAPSRLPSRVVGVFHRWKSGSARPRNHASTSASDSGSQAHSRSP